jgi:hypothetical protein
VQFDEFTKLRLAEKVIVPVAPETKHMNNYVHLIGMVYRDDENSMLYASTRLAVQRGDIVVFRCIVRHNDVVGKEEPNPIHVADVERMLKAFLLTSQPKVVLAGEVSPTKIDVLQTSSRVSPTTPDGQVPEVLKLLT